MSISPAPSGCPVLQFPRMPSNLRSSRMITGNNSAGSAPGRPVRVGIVGYGYWGKNLARNLAVAEATDLVAVVDPDEGAQRAARRNLPGVRVLSCLDELLASDVEAVVLATAAAQ